MRKIYAASLCKNGLLGGGLYIDERKVTFRTGKVTVPARLRNLEMRYEDIEKITEGSLLLLPSVTIKLKNGEEWKFVVFARRDFLRAIKAFTADIQ